MDQNTSSLIAFYRQFMGADDLVFDVGANVGQHSLIFAQIAKRVVALEPSPGSFAALVEATQNTMILPINKAAGRSNGKNTLWISSHEQLAGTSSISLAWIEVVRHSNRFRGGNHWDHSIDVETLTLDTLVESFGEPAFIKIDVEGFEANVLDGLTHPVRALSFEFVRERGLAADLCVQICADLGMRNFNLSFMEEFRLGEWTDTEGIIDRILDFPDDGISYGDVYAKL